MGILGGGGFSLPVITQTEVVDVKITVTESALKQMKSTIKKLFLYELHMFFRNAKYTEDPISKEL